MITRSTRALALFAGFALVCLASCARAPIKNAEQAMRPAKEMPSLVDDLDISTLIKALEDDIRHFETRAQSDLVLQFGPVRIPRAEYVKSLGILLDAAKADPSGEKFRQTLRENFDAYEVYGQNDWGEIFMTSYFEPVIEGSRKKTGRFTQALYGIPKDLVSVDLGAFVANNPALKAKLGVLEQRSQDAVIRGRLITPSSAGSGGVAAGAGNLSKVVPYYDRRQIDVDKAIQGNAVELAYVDPIDSFFLQIQGSGVVMLEGGQELRVGYAAQNGHPYVAIGKHLLHVIPREKMSMQALEAHLRSLKPEEAQAVMNINPSYVFFQQLTGSGITFFGTEVVPGRTVATDQQYFPKGALAFLEYDRPHFASPDASEPSSWERSSRFVLDQDTGGAIRGPHRLDLFWGRGPEARQAAGVIKNKGRLYYFVPKR